MVKFFNKEFLLGLGSGFIISAILVSFFGTGQMSDREILDKASKLGMVMKAAPENTNTSLKVYSDKTDVKKEVDTETENKSEVRAKPEKPLASVKDKTVSITVKSGMGSETIAKLLEEKGAVEDRNEFYQVVTEMKAHTKFRTGTFTVPAGGDMKEIVRIMTGKV